MLEWFYRIGIYLLKGALKVHQHFNKKSALAISGRKNLFINLEKKLQNNTQPIVWFHAASLGEFEQGRPLIEYFKKHHPKYFILLTFFSPSGYEVRKNYEHADYVSYMPFDTPSNARRFVQITQPKMAFFIKYEFWHFHLKALEEAGSWIFSVSSIFRSKQAYFKWFGAFNRNMLKKVDHFFVQNNHSAALLKGINLNNISIVGDTRFDRVHSIAQQAAEIDVIKKFSSDSKVLVAGSSWEPDVKVFAPFLQEHSEWKAIVAPHDISESSLSMHEEQLPKTTQRFSSLKDGARPDTQVILIDNIGMLTSLYQYGNIAFIGGAFGAGLHNTLEAACFGLPIYFGNKKYDKFQEAKDLLEIGAAEAVTNAAAFQKHLERLIAKNRLSTVGEKSRHYILENIGATEKIMKHIDPILKKIEDEG